jgi:hypothetical protein
LLPDARPSPDLDLPPKRISHISKREVRVSLLTNFPVSRAIGNVLFPFGLPT